MPDDLEREVARLRDALEAERRVSEQWRRVAEERRVAMERLRQRRIVRLLLGVARHVLPIVRRWRGRVRRVERGLRGLASGALGARHRVFAGRRQAALERAVGRLDAPAPDDRRVAVVVLTRDGHERLASLLPRLRSLAHTAVEIVVVDNASRAPTREWLARQTDVRVVRNDENLPYSEANNQAVATTDSDVVLLLNDDVEPLDDHWLGRMLTALREDVVAVGAQLVYPRRGLLDGRTRDVSVQHLGIVLRPDGDGPPVAVNAGHGADPDPSLVVREVFGATGACLLVDRAAWDDVGGLAAGYDYGAEDVDLAWRLRAAGGRVVVQPGAVLWHREGATRHTDDLDARARRQEHNWDLLADRWGPSMRRALETDRVLGQMRLTDRPLQVGITVTRDLESAGYGDWYTAHELGEAFVELGWQVHYVERYRDAWYQSCDGLDLLVVLHDEFDVRRVARPGLTTLAWIRNWADRWVGHPWFDDLDIVTASSRVVADDITATTRRRTVPVLPLATNPSRFRAGTGPRHGVVLTVNNWGVDRGIVELVEAIGDVDLYGKGWEDVEAVQPHWRGHVPYDELPAVYARAELVVDQAAPHTLPHESVNSRVFDALATGTAVVTNQAAGARALFGNRLPTWSSPEDVRRVLDDLRTDPEATRQRVVDLRRDVLREHTYAARAQHVRRLLLEHLDGATVVVRIGAPDRRQAAQWGDTYFAEALVAELRAAGHRATTQTLDEWDLRRGKGFDVSLHLKGRSRCPRSTGQVHAVWVISHPDEVDPDELRVADVVFVASEALAAHLRERLPGTRIEVLLQATDERRFRPRTPDPKHAHDVVFVGNSRFSHRPMVEAAATQLDTAVYGANWERYLPPGRVVDRFVPNDQVPVLYSSARVVLNDHWEDMRRWGLVSNRVFDALACGACVVSDDVTGLHELFGPHVATATPETLDAEVRTLLADPQRRERMGREGRRLVLEHHTFRHRVDQLLEGLALVDHAAGGVRAAPGPR